MGLLGARAPHQYNVLVGRAVYCGLTPLLRAVPCEREACVGGPAENAEQLTGMPCPAHDGAHLELGAGNDRGDLLHELD